MRTNLMKAIRIVTCCVALLSLTGTGSSAQAQETRNPLLLCDFGPEFKAESVATSDAQATVTEGGALRVQTGHEAPWPGVTLKAPDGKWDLSPYETIAMEITNRGKESIAVNCRVDNPGADGTNHCLTANITLAPAASGTLTVRIFPVPWKLDKPLELIGMRAAPTHTGKLDTSNVTQLVIFLDHPKADHIFEIDNVRAAGQIQVLDGSTFLPFIDEFGQYIHKEWPGKTHSIEELIAYGRAEKQDLETHPGPEDRNQYGGWASGPELRATGFFRVQKYKDKWWLVDPNGRLFWSHGIDCVRSGNATPITDREAYYKDLPGEDSPFAQFYGTGSWAPHGYYKDHCPYQTYDFSRANLRRKYGESFESAFTDITHRRFKSWGINTIANWSDASICEQRKTPYVATISFDATPLEGSEGYWGKFYDVFDPNFRSQLRARMEREKGHSADDPWCLGYFVHNELAWGDDTSLAVAALVSPAEQPAKKVFIDDLKAKYETIEKLNEAWGTSYTWWEALLANVEDLKAKYETIEKLNETWGTSHASWEALLADVDDLKAKYGTIEKLNEAWGTSHTAWEAVLQRQEAPDKQKARADLTAFYTKTAETYFRTVREEVKRVAPSQLYLGCRFAWVNDLAAKAATKFCDVVSYNRYKYSVADLKLPDDIDMPLIIGEFHFGALDRGMFHTGLRRTENQQDRADKYAAYVRGALSNPC
ncbi:MAG: beta-galactosidase, partial [Phycisphaerales bacterium]